MNRRILSATAMLLTALSVILVALRQFETGMYVSVAAFISATLSVKKATLPPDPYVHLISSVVLGICLTPVWDQFPYFLAACVLFSMTGTFRLIFAYKVGLFGALWAELIFTAVGLGFYFLANVLTPAGWQGWVLLLPPIILAVFLTVAHYVDYINMRKAIREDAVFNVEIGKPVPDFSLPDHEGNTVTLSDYKKTGKHVLLIFVRGDWCPSCHIMLRTYQRNKEKFGSRNITIMAIGPDPVGVNRQMVESLNVDYKILSDDSLECSGRYGIKRAANSMGGGYEEGIPLPASFLVCSQGILRYTSRADKPGEILNPAGIFPVIDQLN